MNNACPECGAVYAVAEKDVGRRIACKKCNTALVVADDGLVRDEGAAPIVPKKEDSSERVRSRDRDDEDRPRKRRDRDDDEVEGRPRRPRGPGAAAILAKLKGVADVATWLYGFGLVLVIYSYFSPQIDLAKISGRQGDVRYAEAEDKADQMDIDSRNDGKPSEDDRKSREKRKKEFDRDLPRLQNKISMAQSGALQASWLNVMIRLIGFAILAFGSIAYLTGDHSQLRRILGGVTILLILLEVVGGSAGLHLQMGGREVVGKG